MSRGNVADTKVHSNKATFNSSLVPSDERRENQKILSSVSSNQETEIRDSSVVDTADGDTTNGETTGQDFTEETTAQDTTEQDSVASETTTDTKPKQPKYFCKRITSDDDITESQAVEEKEETKCPALEVKSTKKCAKTCKKSSVVVDLLDGFFDSDCKEKQRKGSNIGASRNKTCAFRPKTMETEVHANGDMEESCSHTDPESPTDEADDVIVVTIPHRRSSNTRKIFTFKRRQSSSLTSRSSQPLCDPEELECECDDECAKPDCQDGQSRQGLTQSEVDTLVNHVVDHRMDEMKKTMNEAFLNHFNVIHPPSPKLSASQFPKGGTSLSDADDVTTIVNTIVEKRMAGLQDKFPCSGSDTLVAEVTTRTKQRATMPQGHIGLDAQLKYSLFVALAVLLIGLLFMFKLPNTKPERVPGVRVVIQEKPAIKSPPIEAKPLASTPVQTPSEVKGSDGSLGSKSKPKLIKPSRKNTEPKKESGMGTNGNGPCPEK